MYLQLIKLSSSNQKYQPFTLWSYFLWLCVSVFEFTTIFRQLGNLEFSVVYNVLKSSGVLWHEDVICLFAHYIIIIVQINLKALEY